MDWLVDGKAFPAKSSSVSMMVTLMVVVVLGVILRMSCSRWWLWWWLPLHQLIVTILAHSHGLADLQTIYGRLESGTSARRWTNTRGCVFVRDGEGKRKWMKSRVTNLVLSPWRDHWIHLP